jgi:RNA polymerase sigma-70 factor, ECF subfamily
VIPAVKLANMDVPERTTSHDTFVRLFSREARRVYSFILTLVFNHNDADEIFQNTSVVLWNKFDAFAEGTSFFSWACRIAYLEVLNYRRSRRELLGLSEEALESLAAEAQSLADGHDVLGEALAECLEKLSRADRDMVNLRYYHRRAPKEIADVRSKSIHSVYRALSRIHNALHECIRQSSAG